MQKKIMESWRQKNRGKEIEKEEQKKRILQIQKLFSILNNMLGLWMENVLQIIVLGGIFAKGYHGKLETNKKRK